MMKMSVGAGLVLGALVQAACGGSPELKAKEPKLVPAGGDPAPRLLVPPSDEPMPGLAVTIDNDEKAERRPRLIKAREHALMRRFEEKESVGQPIPRACAGAADAELVPDPAMVNAPANDSIENAAEPEVECYPDTQYVDRLCSGRYPGVALVMFAKESPWVRAYMKGSTKAWITAPGAQADENLLFREEVLILQDNSAPDATGVSVSNGDSFYALRFNGSCVKLTQEEVSLHVIDEKASAPVTWKWLDDAQQAVLQEDEAIHSAVRQMKKACRGARLGSLPPECEQLSDDLTELVASYVRNESTLPDPENLP